MLDVRANELTELPASLAGLRDLEKLDLRWKPLASKPRVAAALEARGCFVLW